MSNNRNGFADALNQINTLMDIGEEVELEVLEEAANFFAEKLADAIPIGSGTQHLKNEIEVKVKGDMVQVIFSDKAWYWSLADKGHKKPNGRGRVKGLHFTKKTIDTYRDKIADMMAQKMINRMEG